MAYQPEWLHINPRTDMGPEGWMPCDMDFTMYYSIYHIHVLSSLKCRRKWRQILKYLTVDLIVVTYFSLWRHNAFFARRSDMGNLWHHQYHAMQILHNHYQVYDKTSCCYIVLQSTMGEACPTVPTLPPRKSTELCVPPTVLDEDSEGWEESSST
jgi:hypothetical protein